MSRRAARCAAVVGAVAIAAATAACTGPSRPGAAPTRGPATQALSTAPAPALAVSGSATTAAAAPAAATSPAPPGAPATTAPPPAPPCAAAAVQVGATRLPGATGTSYALLVFRHPAGAACSLTGAPTATLLDAAHQVLGTPAVAAGGGGTAVPLAAGGSASTLLVDDAGACTVGVRSAFVRVGTPGTAATVDLPLALPPCALQVAPVVAGTAPTP